MNDQNVNPDNKYDVIIIGGGLNGMLQSLSLAVHGISCAIIDHNDAANMQKFEYDGRTSAITSASLNMINLLGLDENLLGHSEAVDKIMVREGHDGAPIIFEDGDLLARIFENQKLRLALWDAVQKNDHISPYFASNVAQHHVHDHGVDIILGDGTNLTADLLIGADGSNSQVRQWAKIALSQWQYDHHALVGAVLHNKPHDNIAHEIFFNEGPLALLPMPNSAPKPAPKTMPKPGPKPGPKSGPNMGSSSEKSDDGLYRSSLIWSVPKHQSAAYMKLSPAIFCHELDKKTNGLLGSPRLATPLSSYPLGFHSAAQLTTKRIALIGDSAHRVHPIAGQGLNLGFRDVAALTEILVDGTRLGLECGDAQLLERYERWRSLDNLSVSMATDGVNQIYAWRGKFAASVRQMGMGLIQKSDSIKNLLTQEARGAAGELPKMLSGQLV